MFEPADVSKIKDAIQKVLDGKLCLEPDSISLCEILSIFHEIKSDKKRIKDEIESKLNDAIDRAAVETYEQIKRETEILLSGKRGKNIMINTILSEENARTSEAR
jgi:hypothetical protein